MERGIGCCYRRWHYDIDGTLIATPAEPSDRIRDRVVHGAYPTQEYEGLVFAYLGPSAAMPRFPRFDTQAIEGTLAVPFALEAPCNWLQVYENTQDPVHVVYLHTRMIGPQFGAAAGADELSEFGAIVVDSLIETAGQSAQCRRARLERLLAERHR